MRTRWLSWRKRATLRRRWTSTRDSRGILPARELLGDWLLELNRPTQALKVYEQTLATDQNRLRSVYGAAKTADRHQRLAPGPKRLGKLFPAANECAARKTKTNVSQANGGDCAASSR